MPTTRTNIVQGSSLNGTQNVSGMDVRNPNQYTCRFDKSWKCDITGVRGLHYIDLKHVSPFISSTKSI